MSKHDAEAYGLAWSMFTRMCASYEATPEKVDAAWLEDETREFWLDEAQAVLDYQRTLWTAALEELSLSDVEDVDWFLTTGVLRASLELARDGEDVDLILLTLCANSDIYVGGDDDDDD